MVNNCLSNYNINLMKNNYALQNIYKTIIDYKNDDNGDDRDPDEIAQYVIDMFGENKYSYLRFVLFPDIYEPVRPPSIFPYPTHIFRDVGSSSLTSANGGLYIAWAPFFRPDRTIASLLVTYNGTNANDNTPDLVPAVTGENMRLFQPPTVTGIDMIRTRGLGAYIQVTYVGRSDELAGSIEVGIGIDDGTNISGIGMKNVPTSSLKSLYQYKRMDVDQGCRCVWLPLSAAAFEQTGANPDYAYLSQVYYIHILGATSSAGAFRIDWGYYYDGVVDETGYNTLMPKRSPRDVATRDNVLKVVSESADATAITPAKTDEGGFGTQIWNSIREGFKSGINMLTHQAITDGIGIVSGRGIFK